MDRLTARDAAFAAALRARVRGQVKEAEPLARYSTYRIGGPATVLHPAAGEDVGTALRLAHEAGIPWFVVGLGRNGMEYSVCLIGVLLAVAWRSWPESVPGRRR